MSTQQEKFKEIADAIREKTGSTDLIKPSEFASKVGEVYEAGQQSMVDESKIIEATATGTGIVNIDDISEIPHDITVQLSSDTITDFSGVEVDVYGKNLLTAHDLYNKNEQYRTEIIDGRECVRFIDSRGYKLENVPLKENTTYTISMWAKSTIKSDANTLGSVLWEFYYSDGTSEALTIPRNRDWSFYSKSSNATKTLVAIGMRSYNYVNWIYVDVNTFQLEASPTYSDYEPVDKRTFTANADGTVDGIPYHSPNMTVVADADIMVNYHKSYGKYNEWGLFWDCYQNMGKRNDYEYGFYGTSWTEANFRPKYDIKPVYTGMMFKGCMVLDLKKCLEDRGVVMDWSNATSGTRQFAWATVKYLPELNVSKLENLNQTFYGVSQLKSIDKLILADDGSQTMNSLPFYNNSSLTDIVIEGLFGVSVSFQWSPLTAESAISIITHLKDYKGTDSEFANTLTLSSSTKTALEAEGATSPNGNTWAEYIKDIGWNLA